MAKKEYHQSTLSVRISELRKTNNISQQQLALVLKIDQTTVSQYELGKCLPTHKMACKIAAYFDVSLDYLLGRTDEKRNLNL